MHDFHAEAGKSFLLLPTGPQCQHQSLAVNQSLHPDSVCKTLYYSDSTQLIPPLLKSVISRIMCLCLSANVSPLMNQPPQQLSAAIGY